MSLCYYLYRKVCLVLASTCHISRSVPSAERNLRRPGSEQSKALAFMVFLVAVINNV